ncbi:uncharacterized protein LOC121258650 [Juglans microcarpa x Juglans regia]|uniref:uncharacterized protein LOC121258650 n=1 Tax=Juglans microcarpa x Juglans regia TaxID=2249226 RepID=UPI001B7E30E7|nr:uncharacterized protein LOC121258650 [Juglans microcarpa x Juglans regia]
MEEFNDFIEHYGLRDMKSYGSNFSWCNGQVGLAKSWSKLDRCLMNSIAVENLPNAILNYLPRTSSNHTPMVIELKPNESRYGPSSFTFQQMWMSHDGFRDMVKEVWQEQHTEAGLLCLTRKQKRLKVALKEWNTRVFRRTEHQIKSLELTIERLEHQLQQQFFEEVKAKLLVAREELAVWVQWGSLRPVLQVLCFEVKTSDTGNEGERWTYFENTGRIHLGAMEYFQENQLLMQLPSIQEIKEAMFSIQIDSSPGPDGLDWVFTSRAGIL